MIGLPPQTRVKGVGRHNNNPSTSICKRNMATDFSALYYNKILDVVWLPGDMIVEASLTTIMEATVIC